LLKQCTGRETEVLQNGKVFIKIPSVATRRKVWSKAMLEGRYPELSVAANMYLSMHATTCVSGRNLFSFGRLFDKGRRSSSLEKAEKVSVAENSQQRELADHELMFEGLAFE
jgi:hypothetical protein